MKKIMLSATALVFSVALFAQTGSVPAAAKAAPKNVVAQNTTKPADTKSDGKTTKDEKKKEHKGKHHKGKDAPKK